MAFLATMPAPSHMEALTPRLTRRQVEETIEVLIAYLDALDGDCDLEDGDEDRCAAGEDLGASAEASQWTRDHRPGDPDDAEEGGEAEDDATYLPTSPFGDRLNQDPTDDPRFRHLMTSERHLPFLAC